MKENVEVSKYMIYGAIITIFALVGIWVVTPVFMPNTGASDIIVASEDTSPLIGCDVILTPEHDYIIRYTSTGDEDMLRVECIANMYLNNAVAFGSYDFIKPTSGDYTIRNPFYSNDPAMIGKPRVIRVSVIRGHDVTVGYYS
jgi:hypothetical protein